MPDNENPALTAEQLQAAVKQVKAAPPIFTPTATRISPRPKDKFFSHIADLQMDGNPHPCRKAAVQAALKTLAEDFPDADLLEGRIETSGTAAAHQILVQVTQHKY